MTYLWKLSRRNAHARSMLLTSIAGVLVACGAGDAPAGGLGPLPTDSLGSIVVSPANTTIGFNQPAQFSVYGKTRAGDSVGVTALWSSTGGTITQAGLYTAGTVAGTFQVIGLTADGSLADTALVTLTGSPPTPPPNPSPTVLFQEHFENSSFSARGWYDNTSLVTTTAEHAPGSTRALEERFTTGATKPVNGGAARHAFPETDAVYVSYWVKYSTNWVGSSKTYHPHEFQLVTNEDTRYVGPSVTHLTTYIEHNYQRGGIPVLRMQDASNIVAARVGQDLSAITEIRAAAGCNGNTDGYSTNCYLSGGQYRNSKSWQTAGAYFSPNPGAGYKSNWNHVEVYFKLNTIRNGIGQTDGTAQYWYNGQLVIDKRNVLFRTGAHPTMKFNQFIVAPYIGDGSPVTQTMWVDDLVVATGRL